MVEGPEARLIALGIELPEAAAPAANYVPFVLTGNQLWIAGQVPFKNGKIAYRGKSRRGPADRRRHRSSPDLWTQHSRAGQGGARQSGPCGPGREAGRVRKCPARFHRAPEDYQRRLRSHRGSLRRRRQARPICGRRRRTSDELSRRNRCRHGDHMTIGNATRNVCSSRRDA